MGHQNFLVTKIVRKFEPKDWGVF